MQARPTICLVFIAAMWAALASGSAARLAAAAGEKDAAVIGMIHHVSGTILTLKDARLVGTTQPPAGLGTDGLLELTLDKKTKGAASDLKAGDVVRVSYRPDSRKRLRALTVAPAPR